LRPLSLQWKIFGLPLPVRLALIDQSIDKSREALRARPGDPSAGQYLLAAYARKVELMQEVAIQ